MADIIVGSAAVEIVPSMRTFGSRLRAEIDPLAEKIGREIGDAIARHIAPAIKKGLAEGFAGSSTEAGRAGGKSGDEFGGKFAKSARAHIQAALKALPAANVRVNTREAELELRYLREEMQTLLNKEIGVDISDKDALAKIDELQARLAAFGATSETVQIKVDTAAASAQLLAFRATLGALGGGGGGGGGAGLGGISNAGKGIAGSFASATASSGPLLAAIAAIGVALVPVVATAAGLAAALVLPIAAASGGLALGGILAGFAVKKLTETDKKIKQLRKSAETLNDPKAAAAARKQAQDLEDSLTKPQKAFLSAKDSLGKAFKTLTTGKTGEALFAPLVAGMGLLAKIMPAVSPIIKSVSTAIVGLIDSLSKGAGGKGFTSFIEGFAKLAGATITTAGTAIASFGRGLFNIFSAFLPLSSSVGKGLIGLGAQFEAFSKKASTKQGIASFIDYVKKNGPVVAAFFGQAIVAIVRLGVAVAPLGAKMLQVGTAILKAFNSVPIKTLRTVLLQLTGPFGQIINLLKLVGVSFSDIGHAFRAVYNSVIGPVLTFILLSLGNFAKVWATTLSVLGHVPGFGWAKDASKALKVAGDGAVTLGHNIKSLPKGKVDIDTSQLDKVNKAYLSTDASLRKLLGLPPLKPKADPKPLQDMSVAAQKARNAIREVQGLPPLKIKVDTKEAKAAAKSITDTMRKLGLLKPKPKVDVNFNAVKSAVAAVKRLLDSLHNKTVNILTKYSKTGPQPTARGGTFYGAQTRLIAEAGPEAVVPLNRPLSQVDPSVRWLSAIAQGISDTGQASAATSRSASAGLPIAAPTGPQAFVITNWNTGEGYFREFAAQEVDAAQGFAQTIGGMSR